MMYVKAVGRLHLELAVGRLQLEMLDDTNLFFFF